MPLLSGHHLRHAFGAQDLFRDLVFKIEARERIGLVGPNGVGKTTLLRMIAGQLEPEEGEISRQSDLTLGHLHQEAVLTLTGRTHTIFEEMLTVFADLTTLEKELRELEGRMAAGEQEPALFEQYGELQSRYEAAGGYHYQVKIRTVLDGLGFPAESWQIPVAHLSGGQKTRVLLARLLLEEPDLLILDEPTNHLDQEAVEWLERTLRGWPGTLLIVSHDRYFLDRVATHIWEMSPTALASYKGNYSSYVAQRQAAFEREEKLFLSEQERLTRELDWIRRHMAGGKTDMAKGRLKRLTRDLILIEQVGVTGKEGKAWSEIGGRVRTFSVNEAAVKLRELQPPGGRPPRLNIKLVTAERSGQLVLRTKRLTIGYEEKPLFTTDKLYVDRGECIALIGPNGSGKSTFLKTLLGEVDPLRGTITYGENVRVGYFAQAHEQLDPAKQVLEEIMSRFPLGEREARNHLAAYLFRGHDVFKSISALSGGERGRLALSLLALEGANLLLLDEPTNHLDIPSQEYLQEVLESFDGTILLVSHDRYLIDHLATQIWRIDPEEERLHVFAGSYAAFMGEEEREPGAGDPAEPAEDRGVKVGGAGRQPTTPVDLSWVEEIAPPPEPAAGSPGKRRGRTGGAVQRLEAYLDKLIEELELAQLSGDEDEIEFLEKEIASTEAELGDLI